LGAYGYLIRVTLEDDVLRRISEEAAGTGEIRVRCAVPREGGPASGLTIYGYDAGRFPIGPTVVVEWEQ
jgi:hypothetical protein